MKNSNHDTSQQPTIFDGKDPKDSSLSSEGQTMKDEKNPSQESSKKKSKDDSVSRGELFRKTRESKGFSLENIHEATKIPIDALRSIEEGYTVRNLSSFYHKGFVKMYAKYLDLDITQVIDDYKKEELPKPIKREIEFDFDVREWLVKFLTRKRKRQLLIAAGIIVAFILLGKLIAYYSGRSQRAGKSETASVKLEESKKEKTKEESSASAATTVIPQVDPPQTPSPASSVQEVPKNITLTVRAHKKSWLNVKADDEVVFKSTLREGAVETWTADEQIEISGRNINLLEFELNGRMIGPLGRKDRRAKRVIVTKEGLKVTK